MTVLLTIVEFKIRAAEWPIKMDDPSNDPETGISFFQYSTLSRIWNYGNPDFDYVFQHHSIKGKWNRWEILNEAGLILQRHAYWYILPVLLLR